VHKELTESHSISNYPHEHAHNGVGGGACSMWLHYGVCSALPIATDNAKQWDHLLEMSKSCSLIKPACSVKSFKRT